MNMARENPQTAFDDEYAKQREVVYIATAIYTALMNDYMMFEVLPLLIKIGGEVAVTLSGEIGETAVGLGQATSEIMLTPQEIAEYGSKAVPG